MFDHYSRPVDVRSCLVATSCVLLGCFERSVHTTSGIVSSVATEIGYSWSNICSMSPVVVFKSVFNHIRHWCLSTSFPCCQLSLCMSITRPPVWNCLIFFPAHLSEFSLDFECWSFNFCIISSFLWRFQ